MFTNNIALKRTKREFSEVVETEEFKSKEIGLEMVGDDWSHYKAFITGPPDTPYHGGKFYLDVKMTENYPFHAPEVKFLTKVWHPNISSQTGVICLDILNGQWAAILTIRTVLLSITALLAAPEPDNPQDGVVAAQFMRNKKVFKKTAQHWTAVFAEGKHPVPDYEEKVKAIVNMGVDKTVAVSSLSNNNWDLELTVDRL